jgi:DNA polymerase elongation subunit (family B)
MNDTWQNLWCDKISKTVPENFDEAETYHKKAGILAEFGKIVCISTAVFAEDEEHNLTLRIKSFSGNDEADVLNTFIEVCNKLYKYNKQFQFAGHNIKEFDIPYICRRMLINQIALPEYLQLHDKKPWETKMFDTLNWWKFGDNKNYTSLNLLANVLNVPTSKTDIDGSMVQDVYYKEKNLKRIVEYCQRDVVTTANIILRFHNKTLLTESNIVIVP